MILVVGSTGQLGNRITRQLLMAGQEVRILIRGHSDYHLLVDAGAHPVIGDLKDPPSLVPAMEGIDAVISTATAGGRGGADTIESVDLNGNKHLIDAAKQAGIRKFVFASTIGSHPNSPIEMFRAKGISEAQLRESGMDYTILQSNGYMDVWIPLIVGLPLQQGLPVGIIGEGLRKHSFVAQKDVAAFAIAAIDHPAAGNQTLMIGGPAAISWRDIIATVAKVLERPIQVNTYPPGTMLPGIPPMVSHFMAAQDTYDSPIEMEETARTFGITLTPLEEWVREEFAPMVPAPSIRIDTRPGQQPMTPSDGE